MIDEIKENPRLLVIVLVTGVVAVTIFAIFLLIIVWTPKTNIVDNNGIIVSEDIKIGRYNMPYINENAIVERYCRNILNTFSGGDINLISGVILPEYLEFRGINKSEINTILTQKGLLGKILKFSDYKVATHPMYGRVFEVSISSHDGTYSDKMFIIQKSPNDYKVSFDGFIGSKNNVKTSTIDGLRLEINQMKELTTLISTKITLTNVSGHTITINKDNNYENIYLKLSTGSEIRMSSTWLSGETKELVNGHAVNLNAEFVTSGLSSGLAKSIIIKNVYDNISRETKDIEFEIN